MFYTWPTPQLSGGCRWPFQHVRSSHAPGPVLVDGWEHQRVNKPKEVTNVIMLLGSNDACQVCRCSMSALIWGLWGSEVDEHFQRLRVQSNHT